MTFDRKYSSASACGGQAVGELTPPNRVTQAIPMTRLEAAHEKQFRALVRLRDMTSRTLAMANRLVGAPPAPTPDAAMRVSASGMAGQNSNTTALPLVRRIEETADFVHEAIDDIEEALNRLGSL